MEKNVRNKKVKKGKKERKRWNKRKKKLELKAKKGGMD